MIFKLLAKLEQVETRVTRVKHQNPSSIVNEINPINSNLNDDKDKGIKIMRTLKAVVIK